MIEWYDSELNALGTDSYPFSGASVSQTNAHIQGDTVFLAPTGEEQKKDYGKIALINPTKGSFEEINTGRVNQYDCSVEGDYLALIAQGKLVKYSTVTQEWESVTLSHSDALNLNIVGDVTWIAYTDPFDENSHSSIEARNYQTGEVLCSEEFDGAILQLEADDNRLFVRTYEELIAYSFANGKLTEQRRIRCEKKGYYYGGFFYLEAK